MFSMPRLSTLADRRDRREGGAAGGCTNELMVANGNQLFATLFADPHGNAPAVSWSWACQMNLRRQDTLNCSQRGMPRCVPPAVWCSW